jgi:adenylylsulfate kinase
LTGALLITGTIGVGKTATAIEVGEQLQAKGITAAVIDLDWLCWLCSPDASEEQIDRVLTTNLAAVMPGFIEAGASRFVLARAVRIPANLDSIRSGLGHVPLFTVRLDAEPNVIETRLAARHEGEELAAHLAESRAFTDRLDAMDLDAVVRTDGLSSSSAAEAVRAAADW